MKNFAAAWWLLRYRLNPMTTPQLALVACLMWSLGPSAVAAQERAPDVDASELETEARARFSLGQLYYAQARFADAAREFEAAYASHPHPLLLHNIYLSRRDMGDVSGATDALTRYLATATDLSASDRRVLERRLVVMQHQLESAAPLPPTEPEPEQPVDTVVEAGPTGDVHEPSAPEADLAAEPRSTAPAQTGDDGLMIGAITSFSLAGAAVITLSITGGLAMGERDRLASSCAPACSDDEVSTARTLGAVTDVGIGVASVAAAAGILLAVLASVSTHADVSITPSASTDHAAIIVGGVF
jgi:hypothetical protein